MTAPNAKPRAGEHTEGPWQQALMIETRDGAKGAYPSAAILAISGEDVAVCCGKDKGKANARRIVACVNACEGIPTTSLELGDTNQWIKEEITLRAERDSLAAQNKELVEACKLALDCATRPGGDIKARAAEVIAKLKAALRGA